MKFNTIHINKHLVNLEERGQRLKRWGFKILNPEHPCACEEAPLMYSEIRKNGIHNGYRHLGQIRKSPGALNHILNSEAYTIYPFSKLQEQHLRQGFEEGFKFEYSLPLILLGKTPELEYNTKGASHATDSNFNANPNPDYAIIDAFGCYLPVINIILIDTEKILHFIEQENPNVEYNVFFETVLYHELGHWLSHEMGCNTYSPELSNSPDKNNPYWVLEQLGFFPFEIWEDESFINSSVEIKEFWAQYLSFLIMDHGQKAFQKHLALNHQSKPYQLYLLAEKKEPKRVLKLLYKSREMQWPELEKEIEALQ